MSLLHGIMSRHGPNIRYINVYNPKTSSAATVAMSTIVITLNCPATHQVFDAIAVIIIGIFSLLHFPDLTHYSQFELPFLSRLIFINSIQLLFHKRNFWFRSQFIHTPGSPVSYRVTDNNQTVKTWNIPGF